jgi:MFS family permease
MRFKNQFFSKEAHEIFKFSGFRRFLVTRIFLTLAVQIQNVTLYWQVFDITKDPLSLGFIGLSEALPSLAVALFAGHLADRYNRRMIAFLSLLLFAITSLLLLLVSLGYIPLGDKAMNIYIIVFISGLARGFFRPSSFALMTQLVPRELYAKSAAWNSTFWQTSTVAGAALGGVFIAYLGIGASYLIALLLIVAGAFLIIGIKVIVEQKSGEKQPFLQSLTSGVAFVFKNQVILSAMTLDLIAVLFGGAVALLPAFAQQILFIGPVKFGLLNAAPSAGAIITAIYLAYKPPLKNAGKNLLISVGGFGICMIAFALSTNFYLSLLILALSGLFDSVSVVIRSSIMQLLTPDEMRGRVSAVNTMFIGSSNELGAFESGVMAKLIGLIPSVVLGGGVAVFSSLVASKVAPKLKKLSL